MGGNTKSSRIKSVPEHILFDSECDYIWSDPRRMILHTAALDIRIYKCVIFNSII